MKSRTLIAAILVLAATVSTAHAGLNVVATLPDLAAITKEIGGDKVSVVSLALPTQDPHFVDAKPNLALKLAKADLLVYAGLDLEIGWLPKLIVGSRNAVIQSGAKGNLDASTLVALLDVPSQKIDRSMGDIHPGGNPHYLFDPRRAIVVGKGIAQRMGEIDPANAAAYEAGYQAFAKTLTASITGWSARLAGLKGRPVIAYHKSFVYLEDWLGFVVVEHLEPKPGIPPNPKHVMSVIETAKAKKAVLILEESYYPAKTTELVAEKIGGSVVIIDGGADFDGGSTYAEHIEKMVQALEKGVAASGGA